jgi:signal peptide peptidase SppA
VIRGLKEAARDDEIRTVILRIDSGGGGVVESESIWDAVNQLRAKGKIVIASFANAAASGGYLVATHADLVCAHPSTITGSIGVASLRPTVTQTFLDRIYLNVQSFFTGSKSQSLLHELEGDELDRHRQHVDEMYDMFKGHVCDGRAIAPEEVEAFAGGRVFSGLRAYGFTAPADLLEQLKRDQNLLPLRAEPAAEDVAALAELEAAPAVQLDPDQSMSPFAPVIEEGEIPPPEVEFDMPPEPQLGPKGRGLVDMLGGLCAS